MPIFITPKTPHYVATLSLSLDVQHYFFLPLPLLLVAEPLVATLLALDGVAEAGDALPLTVSSCLFCNHVSTYAVANRTINSTYLDTILGLLLLRLLLFLFLRLLFFKPTLPILILDIALTELTDDC